MRTSIVGPGGVSAEDALAATRDLPGGASGGGAAGKSGGQSGSGSGDAAAGASGSSSTVPTTTDFGEAEKPITVPPAPTTVRSPEAGVVEDVARQFLTRYWSTEPRTYAKLADDLAPFATDQFLAGYRDPARAGRPVNREEGSKVVEITVTATAVNDTEATVMGRAVIQSGPQSLQPNARRVVWRTLTLTRRPAPPPPPPPTPPPSDQPADPAKPAETTKPPPTPPPAPPAPRPWKVAAVS